MSEEALPVNDGGGGGDALEDDLTTAKELPHADPSQAEKVQTYMSVAVALLGNAETTIAQLREMLRSANASLDEERAKSERLTAELATSKQTTADYVNKDVRTNENFASLMHDLIERARPIHNRVAEVDLNLEPARKKIRHTLSVESLLGLSTPSARAGSTIGCAVNFPATTHTTLKGSHGAACRSTPLPLNPTSPRLNWLPSARLDLSKSLSQGSLHEEVGSSSACLEAVLDENIKFAWIRDEVATPVSYQIGERITSGDVSDSAAERNGRFFVATGRTLHVLERAEAELRQHTKLTCNNLIAVSRVEAAGSLVAIEGKISGHIYLWIVDVSQRYQPIHVTRILEPKKLEWQLWEAGAVVWNKGKIECLMRNETASALELRWTSEELRDAENPLTIGRLRWNVSSSGRVLFMRNGAAPHLYQFHIPSRTLIHRSPASLPVPRGFLACLEDNSFVISTADNLEEFTYEIDENGEWNYERIRSTTRQPQINVRRLQRTTKGTFIGIGGDEQKELYIRKLGGDKWITAKRKVGIAAILLLEDKDKEEREDEIEELVLLVDRDGYTEELQVDEMLSNGRANASNEV